MSIKQLTTGVSWAIWAADWSTFWATCWPWDTTCWFCCCCCSCCWTHSAEHKGIQTVTHISGCPPCVCSWLVEGVPLAVGILLGYWDGEGEIVTGSAQARWHSAWHIDAQADCGVWFRAQDCWHAEKSCFFDWYFKWSFEKVLIRSKQGREIAVLCYSNITYLTIR